MKGLVYTKPGGLEVLKIMEVPKPVPKDDEVLVNIKASALNIIDYERFKNLDGKMGLLPRIVNTVQGSTGKVLGCEGSGVVAQVGKDISHVKIGDEVYGRTPGIVGSGAWAEYAIMEKDHVGHKPFNLSFEEASAIPISGETALGGIRKAGIKPGQQVMIYGASGGVGQYAIQFAKALGATVTGVCSTRNQEIARSLGCDYVIDYKKEDFRKVGRKFDAIIGINGNNSMGDYKKLLKDNGVFVGIGGAKQAMKALFNTPFSKHFTFYAAPLAPVEDYLTYPKELAESGQLRPYIDKVYPIQDVSGAIRYVVTQHTKGKVVLSMDF